MLGRRVLVTFAAVAVVVSACTSTPETTTTLDLPQQGLSPTSSTIPAPPPSSTTTTTTMPETVEVPGTASDSLDPALVDQMRAELAELMVVAEEVRGLPFLSVPTVEILDDADFDARVSDVFSENLDEAELAVDSRLFALLGMLPPGTDLYTLFVDLYTEQVGGFYTGDDRLMVVPAAPDGFTPLQRMTVVHELVHALTDQHFEFNEPYTHLVDNGNGDEAAAMLAAIEGDAYRSSFVYLESLSPGEAAAVVTEAFGIDTTVFDAVPGWIQADLLFPAEQGMTFTNAVVSNGGLAGVDQTYIEPPTTTEQILNFDKFAIGEGTRDLPTPTAVLAGWDVHDDRSFGEWGLRQMLEESIDRGDAVQAAAGWGNDRYRVFTRGEDVAIVMHYVGDAERDAEELADAMIAHIATSMSGGPAVESEGGLLYDQAGIYAFIDRVGDELFFIASTNKAAGADLRSQLGL